MLYWAQNNDALLGGHWAWYVPPGVCIALLCTSLALINYGIDSIVNPRLRDNCGGESQGSSPGWLHCSRCFSPAGT